VTNAERSLARYLENKAAAMERHAAGFTSGDAVRDTIAAECSASDLTGVRRVRIRDFQLVSDSGPGFGGFNLGPSSPELLLGVLASCLTHVYLIGAATQGVRLDSVNVRFEAENNDAGFLGLETADPSYPFNIRGRVHIESGESPERLAALHEYAARACPLTKLVKEPQSVTIEVE
jgi:uncharacterized OsmC-like protein